MTFYPYYNCNGSLSPSDEVSCNEAPVQAEYEGVVQEGVLGGLG